MKVNNICCSLLFYQHYHLILHMYVNILESNYRARGHRSRRVGIHVVQSTYANRRGSANDQTNSRADEHDQRYKQHGNKHHAACDVAVGHIERGVESGHEFAQRANKHGGYKLCDSRPEFQ